MGTRNSWNLDALQLNDETSSPSGDPAAGKWWVYMLNDVLTLEDEAGATYDVVTRTATQTLTNKTLTSPTINTPTIATPAITGAVTINDAGADVDLRAAGDTDQNLFFLDASADSVGIGTNAPGAKLDVRGSVIINEAGAAVNVRIEGATNANLFVTDGTNDRVGIGTASPATLLDVNGSATVKRLLFGASSELTIASGAVTATQTVHTVDTESDAASDDLDTINGGTANAILIIRADNAGRTVVLTTAGNIVTPTAASITLDETYKEVWLKYDGGLSKWIVVFHNAGPGAIDSDDVGYVPTTLADWNSSTDPGDVEQALDQLADRLSDAESDIAGLTAGGISSAGWVALGQTLTYGSADDPTYTITCAGVDLTSTLSAGMRLRISQSTGGTKYAIITKVEFSTDTTITAYFGTDYDLVNEAISSPNFSVVKAPYGFPLDPAKWTVRIVDSSDRSQSNPVNGTWYNVGSTNHQISIPIGVWRVRYQANLYGTKTNSGEYLEITLSTANNSASDAELTCYTVVGVSTMLEYAATVSREKTLTLTSKTLYYLNATSLAGSLTTLSIRGSNGASRTIIEAECAYL